MAEIDHAVAVKDRLYFLLNEADTPQALIKLMNGTFIPVLENTEGLWQALRYCYKASEIAKRAQSELEAQMKNVSHHKTLKVLETLRDKMRQLSDQYFFLHQELMAA